MYYRGWYRCNKCKRIYFRGNTYPYSLCIDHLPKKTRKNLSEKAIKEQIRDKNNSIEKKERYIKEFPFHLVG